MRTLLLRPIIPLKTGMVRLSIRLIKKLGILGMEQKYPQLEASYIYTIAAATFYNYTHFVTTFKIIGISTVGISPYAFIIFDVALPTICAPLNASACAVVAVLFKATSRS